MPPFRYADLPSLDDVAFAWAARSGFPFHIEQVAGAQRALEIALDALPPRLRAGSCGWPQVRRAYCQATGTADPRAGLRHTGFWALWLAARGLAAGDRLSSEQAAELRRALDEVACPFYGIPTVPTQQVWRRRGWAGMNNTAKALVLTTLDDGTVLLDVVATRPRESMRQRTRVANRRRYQSLSPADRDELVKDQRRRRVRARRALRGRACSAPRKRKPG